ncbi:5-formyltetrahydrofolate cyclo-ligase [Dehalobacterium formicoaceticum]|uniref:5-formyltetrahydrofolate cyclo-ligase n=1 Tax=Dehalobacterium formicoaceticum TaxID=51515 RepID=UPI0031F6A585
MKKKQRKELLKIRGSLDRNQVREKSKIICEKILQFPSFQKASTVMLYLPFRNEVDVMPLIEHLWQENKRVVIPVCEPKDIVIVPSELRDLEEDLAPGTWGILEPKADKMRPVAPEELDCVIVPGVAFDEACNRLGYGGGYYDRFLPRLKEQTPKIAVAFAMQIVPSLDPDPYDIPMDLVVTEDKVYSRP